MYVWWYVLDQVILQLEIRMNFAEYIYLRTDRILLESFLSNIYTKDYFFACNGNEKSASSSSLKKDVEADFYVALVVSAEELSEYTKIPNVFSIY